MNFLWLDLMSAEFPCWRDTLGASPRQIHANQIPLMALKHEDVETINLVQFYWIVLAWFGLGDEISNWPWGWVVTEHAQHSTNVGYVVIMWIVN